MDQSSPQVRAKDSTEKPGLADRPGTKSGHYRQPDNDDNNKLIFGPSFQARVIILPCHSHAVHFVLSGFQTDRTRISPPTPPTFIAPSLLPCSRVLIIITYRIVHPITAVASLGRCASA